MESKIELEKEEREEEVAVVVVVVLEIVSAELPESLIPQGSSNLKTMNFHYVLPFLLPQWLVACVLYDLTENTVAGAGDERRWRGFDIAQRKSRIHFGLLDTSNKTHEMSKC